MPDVMIREYIEDGSLVQVLEDWVLTLVIFTCFINTKTTCQGRLDCLSIL